MRVCLIMPCGWFGAALNSFFFFFVRCFCNQEYDVSQEAYCITASIVLITGIFFLKCPSLYCSEEKFDLYKSAQ